METRDEAIGKHSGLGLKQLKLSFYVVCSIYLDIFFST